MLSHAAFEEFSLRYLSQLIAGLTRRKDAETIPVIAFTKGGGGWLESLAATGVDALGIDWSVDLGQARSRVGQRVALQGNMDPAVLFAPPEVIRAEAARILSSYGAGSGHVFNLGHGISQHTPPGSVAVLVDAVHELSCGYHVAA